MSANVTEKKTVAERVEEHDAKCAEKQKLVSEVWKLHQNGASMEAIADKLGVHVSTVKALYSLRRKVAPTVNKRVYDKITADNLDPVVDKEKIKEIADEIMKEELDRSV